MLAKVLRRGGNVLVLDEPTNDLDLASLRMLEEALADFDGTVLLSAMIAISWIAFAIRLLLSRCGLFVQPETIRTISRRKNSGTLPSNQLGRVSRKLLPESGNCQPSRSKPSRKLTFKEQRELEGMETAILAAEARVQELETTLNDPDSTPPAPGSSWPYCRLGSCQGRSDPPVRPLADLTNR